MTIAAAIFFAGSLVALGASLLVMHRIRKALEKMMTLHAEITAADQRIQATSAVAKSMLRISSAINADTRNRLGGL